MDDEHPGAPQNDHPEQSAHSQEPSATKNERNTGSHKERGEQDRDEHQQREGTPDVPQRVEQTATHPVSVERPPGHVERALAWIDRESAVVQAVSAVLLTLVTVVLVVVTWVYAHYAGIQAQANVNIVTATQNAITHADANFAREERPWLAVVAYQPYWYNGKIALNMFIGNHGKTPALEISVAKVLIDGPDMDLNSSDADYFFATDARVYVPGNQVLAPGILANVQSPLFQTAWSLPLYKADADRFLRAEGNVFAAARVWYKDAAGNSYHTDICVFRQDPHTEQYCQHHNEMK